MLRKLFHKLLILAGKNYTVHTDVPDRLIRNILLRRAIMLGRGYLRTGKKVFIGRNCSLLNRSNIAFGANVTLESHCRIDGFASNKISLGDGVKIGCYSKLISTSHLATYGKGLTIGKNSAFGEYTEFGATGGICIGDDVIMGSHVSFHSENHNFSNPVKLIRCQGVTSKGITIGNNVWVGAQVVFLDGCAVGNNSVVAAGAVVNGTYPDNSVIGGVPAKVIKTIT